MQEALNLYVEERSNSEKLAALPDKTIKLSKSVVRVALDREIAFSFLVRYWIITYGWIQKERAVG